MKISRALLVWTALALCGVLVLGAMTWLTRGVLASEKERGQAEARADLEERTRLALWRMDSVGAAIVASENRHPPADYEGDVSAFPPAKDAVVKLHFEIREKGPLISPEAKGNAATAAQLVTLRNLLGTTPLPGDEWMLLKCAADASESAWNAVPKDEPEKKSENVVLRQTKGGSQARSQQDYQANFNGSEKAQRAKTIEETVASSYDVAASQQLEAAPPGQGPSRTITDLGTMRAVWIGGELFLLRQLTASVSGKVEKGIQGVWLDPQGLKTRLLAEVRDLLPASDLATTTGSAEDPLVLVSFPFRLSRNETLPAAAGMINAPLLVGWSAVLLALLTAAFLVRGVMRLSERRASFVSAVTHELRTPLTTFRLYSDMLESGAVKPEKRGDYLKVLSREADRLSHLVENVLSFSKIERGSARSTLRETAIANLLEPMRERLESRLATAGLQLEMDLTGLAAASRVKVDAAAVEHVLFNLIDNAAKYASGTNPPQVAITLAENGGWIRVKVCDHGPGIPVGERDRIFRAFHKSALEAAESRPGVGLGLALSRRLAKSLGGTLKCVDAATGACFVLSLPVLS